MNLEVIQDLLHTDPTAAEITLTAARARVHDAITELRRTVNDLKPTLLDELGLDDAAEFLPTGPRRPTSASAAA
jgi:signal transduction histidine kinase